MDQEHLESEREIKPPVQTAADELLVREARMLLYASLREQASAHLLDEYDERILALRLGLEDGHCYTLQETASLIHKSPEVVRRRQYLALRKAVKDLRFFKLFRDYARLVHLPTGATYYLHKYTDYPDTF